MCVCVRVCVCLSHVFIHVIFMCDENGDGEFEEGVKIDTSK